MGYPRKRKGSDDDGDEVAAKKSKGSGAAPTTHKDDDGNPYWEISGKRRLQISEFKNMTMVNIREYYEKDGKSLPGKAGINLPVEQFQTFVSLLPQVLKELKAKGHSIELPSLDGAASIEGKDGGEDEDEEVAKPQKPKKSNIEATSDEDEDD